MSKKKQDIVLALTYLYEIQLQIGQSFDVEENARQFLKTLMLQQNLSFAGYYTISNSNQLHKVYSIPKTTLGDFEILESTRNVLKKESLKIYHDDDHDYQYFNRLNNFSQSELAVGFAGSKSLLVFGKNGELKNINELIKYTLVFNKFCLFMESLESHHQIKNEIRIKKKQALIIEKTSQQLKDQNLELIQYINSNNELEKFAYRTSHDLKSPLRTLISFSQLLKANKESNLTAKQLEYLDYIQQGGAQMNNLIDGILEYSRVNKLELNKDKIFLNELLEETILLLSENIMRVEAIIRKVDIPKVIVGDKIKIMQLFLNLLGNALKFCREDVVPVITISCEENDLAYTFAVRDNGIGMNPESTNKIFELFEKLNPEHKFQGSGIGLSTCKQIVLQHEGKIWVESELNNGSTFYFSLRKF